MLHLHPLPGDENRYSPEEFERDIKPLIRTGAELPRKDKPRLATEAGFSTNPVKITEKRYSDPCEYSADGTRVTKVYGMDIVVVDSLCGWGEPVGAYTPLPTGTDSGPSELHALQWEDEPPTLWQRFMAWLRGA